MDIPSTAESPEFLVRSSLILAFLLSGCSALTEAPKPEHAVSPKPVPTCSVMAPLQPMHTITLKPDHVAYMESFGLGTVPPCGSISVMIKSPKDRATLALSVPHNSRVETDDGTVERITLNFESVALVELDGTQAGAIIDIDNPSTLEIAPRARILPAMP